LSGGQVTGGHFLLHFGGKRQEPQSVGNGGPALADFFRHFFLTPGKLVLEPAITGGFFDGV
jgi:hypothetical protein